MSARKVAVDKKIQKAADLLIGRILDLAERNWVGPDDLAKLVSELGIRELGAEIYLLRELCDLVRAVPLKVYKDMDQRDRLIGAVQEALDDAIRREEDALDAAEEGSP